MDEVLHNPKLGGLVDVCSSGSMGWWNPRIN